MMYLVYTAMLALNVSAEVVQGFKSVATATHQSNKIISAKLDDTYANFDQALQNSPEKVREMYDRAQEIKKLSADLTHYIDSMEFEFIGSHVAAKASYKDPASSKEWNIILRDESGKAIHDSVKLALDSLGFAWFTDKQLEDNHEPAKFFIGPDVKNPDPEKGAIQIKNKLIEFKKKVNEALGEDSSHVKLNLNVDGGYNKEGDYVDWEVLNFNEVITGAALVTLTRLKAETMNAEYDAVNMLYKKVNKGDKSFSDIAMISRPRSTYILQGGTYETKINVAAYDSKQTFRAVVNGQNLVSGDSGTVVYRTVCNNLGPQRITGTAYDTSPDGGEEQYPINDVFFVAKPAGVVRLDGLQVVYPVVDNPITISAPGIDTRNLTPSIEPAGQAEIVRGTGEGEYIVRPKPEAKVLHINIDATIDRKVTRLAHQKVIVKNIPSPILRLGSFENGAIIRRKEITAGTVVAPFKNPEFLLTVDKKSMKVSKITVAVGARSLTSEGFRITEEMASMIRKANANEQLMISAEVLMPDRKPRKVYFNATLK